MRVDILTNPSQPNGEPAAKPVESVDGIEGAFFAEMDRVLNIGEQGPIQGEEGEAEAHPDDSELGDLHPFLNACIFSVQPAAIQPLAPMNPPGHSLSPPEAATGNSIDGCIDEIASPATGAAGASQSAKADSVPGNSAGVSTANQTLFESTVDSLQHEAGLSERNIAMHGKAIPSSADSPVETAGIQDNAAAVLNPRQREAQDAEGSKQKGFAENSAPKATTPELEPNADLRQGILSASPAMSRDKHPAVSGIAAASESTFTDSADARFQADPTGTAPAIRETSRESIPRTDALAAANLLISEDNSISAPDSGDLPKENPLAGVLKGPEASGKRFSEEKDEGGSQSDPERAPDQFSAIMEQRKKSDGSDLMKSGTGRVEHSREKTAAVSSGLDRFAVATQPLSNSDPAASARPGELVYQVAEKIQLQLRNGRGEIRIQLKPENLGSLEIRAVSTVNGVVARIAVESGSVRNYLENNLHILQQTLQDQGLKVERLQISVQEVFDPHQESGQPSPFGHAGGGSHGGETRKSARSMESGIPDQAEEIVTDGLTSFSGPRSRFHTIA